jgi:hypothetical protein
MIIIIIIIVIIISIIIVKYANIYATIHKYVNHMRFRLNMQK